MSTPTSTSPTHPPTTLYPAEGWGAPKDRHPAPPTDQAVPEPPGALRIPDGIANPV